MTSRAKALSKRMSFILRHRPESVGITLDNQGWVDLDVLVAAMAVDDPTVTTSVILDVVKTNDKKRYEVRRGRIRAAQGHSIDIDLGLQAVVPADDLYHGTVARFLDSIMTEGLIPKKRSHVHLSATIETANQVGQRRGHPVILKIDAASMHGDGLVFYRSSNNVWLTSHVPAKYMRTIQSS